MVITLKVKEKYPKHKYHPLSQLGNKNSKGEKMCYCTCDRPHRHWEGERTLADWMQSWSTAVPGDGGFVLRSVTHRGLQVEAIV